MGDTMKKIICLLMFAMVLISAVYAYATPPSFKQRKYFGPIPYNMVNISVGFLDGPTAEYLTDYLSLWAEYRRGFDTWNDFSTSPFVRIGYERQLSPNHFFRTSASFGYLKATSLGQYIASVTQADTLANIVLDIDRELTVYLIELEAGFSYYIIPPAPRSFSPYVGAGLSAVIPLVRFKTDSYNEGQPFSNPGENISRNSLESGFHAEFGFVYYITNRYSATMEGRYQLAQSEFYIHDANFDLDFSGFTLTLGFNYHF
jgi:opacity protein-like surface antigen